MVVDRTSCETQTTTQSSEGSTAFATSPASKGRCTDHEPGCPAEERQHDVGRAHDILQRLGSFLSKEFFLLGIGVVVLLAHFFPEGGAPDGPHGEIVKPVVHWLSIALIFFISGLSLSTTALRRQALNWKLHITNLVLSFLVFSAVIFGLVSIAKSAQGLDGNIDRWIMAGFVFMGVAPTTVASNIVMTRLCGGNTEGATIEVVLSNVLGVFVTPLLLVMYLNDRSGWGFATPHPGGSGGVTDIYKQMSKQLSLILILPLIVGQIVQNIFPVATARTYKALYLDKVGQVLLLVNIWSAFCNAFYSGAFDRLSNASILFTIFLDFGLYVVMVSLTLCLARLPGLGGKGGNSESPAWIQWLRFDKKDTVALTFCAISKGIVLGTPLLAIFYSSSDAVTQGTLVIPIVIYQGMQVALSQLLVHIFQRWIAQDPSPDEEISPAANLEGGSKLTDEQK